MAVDRGLHSSQPIDEVARALVQAVGVDPANVVVGSVRLTPWDSQHTALLKFEAVFILAGTPAEVQGMAEHGEPIEQAQW